MDTLGRKIQLYRGLETSLPVLSDGEPGCTYDANGSNYKLWVGTSSGVNQLLQAEQHIIDDLVSNLSDASLSAKQGKILKDMIDAIGSSSSSVNVIDNLTSNSPIAALSARQGKVVNDKIVAHANNQTDEKHIEFTTVQPVDLTNTGVVFLRRDETTGTAPEQPTLDELKTELREHEKKIASTTELGHIKVDGTTIKVDSTTGIANAEIRSELPKSLTLLGNWISVQGSLSYYKDHDNVVHIYGVVANRAEISNTSIVATLPEGYRPLNNDFYGTSFFVNKMMVTSLTIKPNGEITSGSGRTTDTNVLIDVSYRIA